MNADQWMQNVMKELENTGERPRLLLNSCCGPCSTSVLEQLVRVFDVTVHFYNPNLDRQEEYDTRLNAQREVLAALTIPLEVLLEEGWRPEPWEKAVAGIRFDREGGARCRACLGWRMERTAALASELGYRWFATTLSVSPHKDAGALNEMGLALERKYGVRYLMSDFKKRDGYRRSVHLSKAFGVYRQHYCGCLESRRGAE